MFASLPRSPALVLLTDTERVQGELTHALSQLPPCFLSWVQARSSLRSAEAYARWFASCRSALHPSIPLLVHGHWSLVRRLAAPGVHLRERQSVREVRTLLGDEVVLGQSVHSLESARRAAAEGVDYLQFGALYPTGCKPGHPGLGLDLLRQVVQKVSVPVVGVGGIDSSAIPEVLQAGASGVAVISAILQSPSPALATKELWSELCAHSKPVSPLSSGKPQTS